MVKCWIWPGFIVRRRKFFDWRRFLVLCRTGHTFRVHCSLDVLYGGLGINKRQWSNKDNKFFSCIFFSSVFGHQNPVSGSEFTWNAGSGSVPDPQLWSQLIGNTDPTTIRELFLSSCNKAALSQRWDIEYINLEQLKKWDDPTKDLVWW
jgi:hypothetical protein